MGGDQHLIISIFRIALVYGADTVEKLHFSIKGLLRYVWSFLYNLISMNILLRKVCKISGTRNFAAFSV